MGDIGAMTGFTASSAAEHNLQLEKSIEQYYVYFTLLAKKLDEFINVTQQELQFIEEKLNEIVERKEFDTWYKKQSWLKKIIWKLQDKDYKQLNNIRKNGI